MCRFLAYFGKEVLLADLLYRPTNSLIRQSFRAQERVEPLNGDGFGVGWYAPEIADTPAVFTSVTPAWSNRSLRRLCDHVRSSCVFAHVRAAPAGSAVSEENCHPFQSGRYLWMHNGTIHGFQGIKRRLCNSLPDHLYQAIEGTTDSEHAFATFLHLMERDTPVPCSGEDLGEALARTICRLEEWTAEAGVRAPSYLNFAVTDGVRMAAVRYVSDETLEPVSLYYSKPSRYECCDGVDRMVGAPEGGQAVIVASERLTDPPDDWIRVAPNHVVSVEPDLRVTVGLITRSGIVTTRSTP